MEAFNASPAAGAASPEQSPLLTLLEASVPGVSLVSGFLKEFLNIDISEYFGILLLGAAVITAFNYCYSSVWGTWNTYFVSSAEVRYNDEVYNYLMYWISKNGVSKQTRHFVVTTHTNSTQVYSPSDSDDEDDDFEYEEDDYSDPNRKPRNWDRMKTLRFTPSTGTHYFRYKGHWLWFTRSQDKDQSIYGSTMTDQVSVSCFSRNPQILKDLVNDAQIAYLERDGNKTIIYRGTKGWGGSSDDMDWVRCMSRPPRPMTTVVLDQEQKDSVLNDMKEYLHPQTKKWYSNRGIPYRRVYLLHGPPGTGKTSLCVALAGLLQLPIYVASLNAKTMTEEGLASLFRCLPARCIVLLEDIDAAGLTNARKSEPTEEEPSPSTADDDASKDKKPGPVAKQEDATPKGISLSGFLNIIDGVASSEGRILVMTTNHVSSLDPALLRPGRVDLTVHFTRATAAVLVGMFTAIYSSSSLDRSTPNGAAANGSAKKPGGGVVVKTPMFLAHHGKTDGEIRRMAEEFARAVPADVFTPAEIQGYLLTHKRDPQAAINEARVFVDKAAKAKQERDEHKVKEMEKLHKAEKQPEKKDD